MGHLRDAQARGAVLCAGVLLFSVLLPAGGSRDSGCDEPASAIEDLEAGLSTHVSCKGGAPVRGPARLLFGGRLDPNVATPMALTALPGIGPARAQAVVEARSVRPFGGLDDLLRVKGVGPATLSRIAPWVEFRSRSAPGERRGG